MSRDGTLPTANITCETCCLYSKSSLITWVVIVCDHAVVRSAEPFYIVFTCSLIVKHIFTSTIGKLETELNDLIITKKFHDICVVNQTINESIIAV